MNTENGSSSYPEGRQERNLGSGVASYKKQRWTLGKTLKINMVYSAIILIQIEVTYLSF